MMKTTKAQKAVRIQTVVVPVDSGTIELGLGTTYHRDGAYERVQEQSAWTTKVVLSDVGLCLKTMHGDGHHVVAHRHDVGNKAYMEDWRFDGFGFFDDERPEPICTLVWDKVDWLRTGCVLFVGDCEESYGELHVPPSQYLKIWRSSHKFMLQSFSGIT